MTVRMRHTRSHTRNRRSHHALTAASLGVCADCNAKKLKHSACPNCGKYKGKVVIDVEAKIAKKQAKAKAGQKAK